MTNLAVIFMSKSVNYSVYSLKFQTETALRPSWITTARIFLCVCVCVVQGHPEARGDADGPPEEDHDQRPTDEGAGPQQECAVCARITPMLRFLSAEV